ncbi:hypothetical protein ACLRDC_15520 [Gluconacetobacter sacchari]|uniref:Uncharacterized protein n=2 Tax=Gluconacetobacter sacchari TaxID=92759 RepID=A0A7W4ICV3_9PROT|nr:hypothetical protein [Gluconacetobacter sacchari]MBB2160384.1 hypothetical protein [Gluconacetobacter sacchari]GBQ30490.1 hypothetical protein AA12717_3514 [Gluconacetobacter sacchari DSM 12717]
MSEYQYYEFQALDRPLDAKACEALRALSSRARITATSFTNSYEWGDFKGDPVVLMERWFDLHLYLTNWGTHRLMVRFPRQFLNSRSLDIFLRPVDCAALKLSGENLILDIVREELEPEDNDWDDGSGWLAALAPLRADIIDGDLRLFYLLWLTAVQDGAVPDDAMEPLPGIGPLTGTLDAFARFFLIDQELVAAAVERPGDTPTTEALTPDTIQRLVAGLPDREKNGLLARLAQGDAHVASELRVRLRERLESRSSASRPVVTLRTAGELRARAHAIGHAREREKQQRLEMERKRQAAEQERARRARLDTLLKRGEAVWSEIEAEIEHRNASGYDKALRLLLDLKTIAEEQGKTEDFSRRLAAMRERHARKLRFIDRLVALG